MQRARQHHHTVFTAFCFPHHRHLAIKIHLFETQAASVVSDFVAEEDLWQYLADVCHESAHRPTLKYFGSNEPTPGRACTTYSAKE